MSLVCAVEIQCWREQAPLDTRPPGTPYTPPKRQDVTSFACDKPLEFHTQGHKWEDEWDGEVVREWLLSIVYSPAFRAWSQLPTEAGLRRYFSVVMTFTRGSGSSSNFCIERVPLEFNVWLSTNPHILTLYRKSFAPVIESIVQAVFQYATVIPSAL